MSARVDLRRFSLPLARPLHTAAGTIESREGVLVRLEGDGVGLGEATPLPGWTEPLEECRARLGRAGDRLASRGPAAALDALEGAPAARHGLDLALADRDARRAGDPLYRHLGGERPVERVPANATVGDGDPERTARAAASATRAGFGCLKVKVGARSVSGDLDRLAAVREAVDAEVELRADANGAWSRERARRALAGMADVGVAYVEQPLTPGDLAGHADLRGGAVGVAIDEGLREAPVGEVLAAGAADVLILKPMALGGVGPAREAADAALAAGVDPVVTTTVDAAVARAGAVHLAASLPVERACGLATGARLARDLAEDPAPVVEGSVRVPDGKGHGAGAAWGE